MRARRQIAIATLIGALALLAASIAFAASRDDDGWGMMRFGPGMMGYASKGGGDRVDNIGEARKRAKGFADRLDLKVGEVMQFSNQYYAELTEKNGKPATEVLVNSRTGAVWLEYGPAMMWNTRYGMMSGAALSGRNGMMGGGMMGGGQGGMMGGGQGGMMGGQGGMMDGTWAPTTSDRRISAAEAQRLAAQWLERNRSGLTAGEAEAFPGYYTLHALRDGRVAGMLSVNAAGGAVWFHWWHGRFVRMQG